jgi:hypothetical protein
MHIRDLAVAQYNKNPGLPEDAIRRLRPQPSKAVALNRFK